MLGILLLTLLYKLVFLLHTSHSLSEALIRSTRLVFMTLTEYNSECRTYAKKAGRSPA